MIKIEVPKELKEYYREWIEENIIDNLMKLYYNYKNEIEENIIKYLFFIDSEIEDEKTSVKENLFKLFCETGIEEIIKKIGKYQTTDEHIKDIEQNLKIFNGLKNIKSGKTDKIKKRRNSINNEIKKLKDEPIVKDYILDVLKNKITDDTLKTITNFNTFIKLEKKELDRLVFIHKPDYFLKKIINYDKINTKTRNEIISKFNINVCPYCNKQYVENYISSIKNKKLANADLDHYYDKGTYWYLSLSLYNFVPSCQICNSRLKRIEDFFENKHINPHKKGFEKNDKFKTDIFENNSLDILKIKSKNDFELKVESNNEEVKNSVKTFQLNERYEVHKEEVLEFLKQNIIYSESKIKEIYQTFELKGSNLFESEEEIRNTIFGNFTDEKNRILSKLKSDILEEFGIKYK